MTETCAYSARSFVISGSEVVMTEVIRVDDCATKADLEAAIAGLRSKQNRMPDAWADRRAEIADEIDDLVTRWLELS